MIDPRYHLLSLVSIFIALGVGIFAGAASAGEGVWRVKEEETVAALLRQFDELRERERLRADEVAQLRRRAEGAEALAARAVAALTRGRLKGLPVLLVASGREEPVPAVARVLSEAGAALQWVGLEALTPGGG
ncbi:MAG: copper transporter, partial [Clostridia bacterium]|nr:copper transporter [Clostridia bacterium]